MLFKGRNFRVAVTLPEPVMLVLHLLVHLQWRPIRCSQYLLAAEASLP